MPVILRSGATKYSACHSEERSDEESLGISCMNKQEFTNLINEGKLYLDGATGSNLQKRGMPSGVCPDKWISENPEALISLQLEFLRSGSRIVYAPTFTANRVKLSEFGLEDRLYELNSILAGESKTAIKRFKEENPSAPDCFVAGDMTMTGRSLYPTGDMDFEELVGIYKEQADALIKAGVDLIAVETMMSLQETRAAVIAIKEISDIPVITTLTFEKDGRTLYGTDPVTALLTLESLGVSAFGINCSLGPVDMLGAIKEIRHYAHIPVICKPNAGLPELDAEGNTVYRLSPEDFASEMEEIARYADILGGCCGTTPEHIRLLKEHTEGIECAKEETGFNDYFLTGERKTFTFSLDDRFFIVGERINPTGKKDLQAELRSGSFDMVRNFAEAEENAGAKILDVNMGMSGVDEKELMVKAIGHITEVTSLPLSIDTSHVDVMEAALRRYPGRALINSVSYESVKTDALFSIAKKYGSMCILLPLSDDGLPKDKEEKEEIIHKLIKKAKEYGLSERDLVVDGLVGAAAANSKAAAEVTDTIRFCHDKLGIATVCGLSNISFGLPERSFVNSSFLVMCIMSGLTMAIANPEQENLMISALSTDLLLGKKGADIPYIEYMEGYAERSEKKETPSKTRKIIKKNLNSEEFTDPVFEAVIKGKRDEAAGIVVKALNTGRNASEILNSSLLPAINRVGELFEEKRYFLPQLIASGEAMKNGIEVLEPLLREEGGENQNRINIVIGTVKGDIHDIGKNLVVMMLKNYGFNVTDLGKDVSKEAFYNAAVEENAGIIAMSALMTTTMREMQNVIGYCLNKGYKGLFMIGGAVITEDYAQEIGAHYSSDASDAVQVAKKITGKERHRQK